MRSKTIYPLSALTLAALLSACGGGSDGSSDGGNSTPVTPAPQAAVTLSGQVVDGPIAGAKVCLFVDGVAARDASSAAICSSETDAQGNYSLSVPRTLSAGLLTLLASKGSDIKLTSALGTLEQLLAAAGSSGTVTSATLPTVRVTHFTTADGVLSSGERDAYAPDIDATQNVAAVIKAVIDFPAQAGDLLGAQTTDTLQLAAAAARKHVLGTSGKTAEEWLAAANNANIRTAVQKDLTDSVESLFARYRFTTSVITQSVPAATTVMVGGTQAGISCMSPLESGSEVVEIALNAQLGIAVVRQSDEPAASSRLIGSFNAKTGEVRFSEVEPRNVSLANSTTTYYSESSHLTLGKLDTQSGAITGTASGTVTNTWTIDGTTKTCTAEGSFKAEKL